MAALDDLADQADKLHQAAPAATGAAPGAAGAAAAPAEVAEDPNTLALCMLVAMVREVVSMPAILNPPLRRPAELLADDVLPQLCAPWGRVLTHYGVNLGGLGGGDHPLIAALFATGPALWKIGTAIAAEIRDRRPIDLPTLDPAPAAPTDGPPSGA